MGLVSVFGRPGAADMNEDPRRTEAPHPLHEGLDTYAPAELVQAFIGDQQIAAQAVLCAAPQITAVVEAALPRLQRGGRLVYVGAGTSGRLGMLDSVELLPTFSWPSARACAVLAGGSGALFQAVEGAEDNPAQGAADLAALSPTPDDVVLLVTASGTTPYVLGALQAASDAGALVVGIVNNPCTPVAERAELAVVLDTGEELVSGSTRLKAGTAQKIALNTISSALMVRMNKVYGNLMVDLRATNAKLQQRALRLTMLASGADEPAARAALAACDERVKVAVVMLGAGIGAAEAERRLDAALGSVGGALER
jgi:N-acetylmuramic acid 6-phosphate etherase